MKCPNILVIDINQDIAGLIKKTFDGHCQVIATPYTLQAIDILSEKTIDFMFVVHQLPEINGLNVLESLKDVHHSLLPTVFISKSPTQDLIISAFRSGAADFLKAPINPDELQLCLERVHSSVQQSQFQTSYFALKRKIINKSRVRHLIQSTQGFLSNMFRKEEIGTMLPEGELSSASDLLSCSLSTPGRISGTTERSIQIPKDLTQEGDSASPVNCYFFGNFRIVINDQIIEKWSSKKGKSLIAYLLFNHKRRIYRDVLMENFWPNTDPDCARNCLNVALHGIRRVISEADSSREYIIFKDECYYINPEIDIRLDVEKFLRYWSKGQTFEQEKNIQDELKYYELAITSYRGDFFEDDLYEDWASLERENLKEIYLTILNRISNYYALNGKPATAISLCEQILQKDNCQEEVHRRIMRCYYRLGRRNRAIKQFHKCAEILKEELEVEPTQMTKNLYEQIKNDSFA